MPKTELVRTLDGEGHYTSLTPALHAGLVKSIRTGQWPVDAAFSNGITPGTLKRFLEKGLRGIAPYAAFLVEFMAAESAHAREVMGTVEEVRTGRADPMCANSQLHAAKYILDTRYRWMWGGATTSAAQLVSDQLEKDSDERKQKALEVLKKLPEAEKKKLRDAGFLLP